jgi:nucleotide-binding universal stress UspA family protein
VFQHILVPADGSDDSWVALEQAIQIAGQEKGVIHGLFVADARLVEAPYMTSMYAYDYLPAYDPTAMEAALEASKRLEERGEQILVKVTEQCQQAGILVQTEQAEGNVSEIILDRAQQADLIVMGRHGEGAPWAGPLLGSTFEAVVRHAPVPVLASQAKVQPTTRLLVAFDGSERAQDGLGIAARWATEREMPIVLLTVDDGHPGREQAYEEAQDLLRKQRLAVTPLFRSGHPAEQILRAARVEDCDLIVMGAYGHSRFLEIFFGSTVDEVMRGATCPLLICR